MITPTVSPDDWAARVQAAVAWREQREAAWQFYALLHRRLVSYAQVADSVCDDTEEITTPHGDNVRVATIFRNVEQALALLDIDEIGVRASVLDYWHETGYTDTHRESIAEKALYRSLLQSGLFRGGGVDDLVKLDGVIIGHGVSYTHWDELRRTVAEQLPALTLDPANGVYVEKIDPKTGLPMTETVEREDVAWEGCRDTHVPVLEFLFDSSSRTIAGASWHGRQWIESLALLETDPEFTLPAGVIGGELTRKSLYGDQWADHSFIDDGVRGLTIYDCVNGELLHFLDSPELESKRPGSEDRVPGSGLRLIGGMSSSVWFTNSTRSPFNVFVPIPCQDDSSGISQIEHIQGLAAEIDILRSRIANSTTLLKRIFLYRKGRGITQEAIDAALEARDFSFLGVDLPEEKAKLTDIFTEFPMPVVRAEFYKLADIAAGDVPGVSGVLEDPWAGGSSATEAEHKYTIGGARMSRKKRLHFRYLSETAETHLCLLRAFGREGERMPVETALGVEELLFGRDALQGAFEIRVTGGGGATALSPVTQKMMMEAAQVVMPLAGPHAILAIARQLLTIMDFPGVSEIMAAARRDLQMTAGPAPGPGRAPAEKVALGDYGPGQAIRRGVNAPYE